MVASRAFADGPVPLVQGGADHTAGRAFSAVVGSLVRADEAEVVSAADAMVEYHRHSPT